MKAAGALLRKGLRDEFAAQGHSLTGTYEASVQVQVSDAGNEQRLAMLALAYGQIVNYGIKPSRIPYGGFGGKGGTSQYIQGLIRFFRLRGLSEEEAKRAAFATAKKQKKEGMSTEGSKQYSKTGERQGFLQRMEEATGPAVDTLVLRGFDDLVGAKFHETKSETV